MEQTLYARVVRLCTIVLKTIMTMKKISHNIQIWSIHSYTEDIL